MIFTCSKCGQKYDIDAARIPAGRASAKCKKCGGAVPLTPPTAEPAAPVTGKPAKVDKPAATKAPKQKSGGCGLYIGLMILAGIVGAAGGFFAPMFLGTEADPLAPAPTQVAAQCPECPQCEAPPPVAAAPEPTAFDSARLGMSAESVFDLAKLYLSQEKTVDKGVETLQIAAVAPLPQAQYSLYALYSKEKGLPGSQTISERNQEEAAKWLTLAAENGLPLAQISLSTAYSEGKLGVKDDEQAKAWLQKAVDGYKSGAEAGDMEAQFMLGLLLTGAGANKSLLGETLPADKKAAVEWLTKAKQQGIDSAQAYQNLLKEHYGPIF